MQKLASTESLNPKQLLALLLVLTAKWDLQYFQPRLACWIGQANHFMNQHGLTSWIRYTDFMFQNYTINYNKVYNYFPSKLKSIYD